MRNYVVVCVEGVIGKKKFQTQFEDGQRREISTCLLSLVCSQKEVDQGVNKTISELLKDRGLIFEIARLKKVCICLDFIFYVLLRRD